VLQVLLAFLPEREMLRGPLFLVLLVLLAVVIGIVESVMARLKMLHVPYLLISALLFCSFAFILLIR
jgi:formate hydrogenlyase subunit 4